MSKILAKELLVIAVITLLVLSGVIFHSPSSNRIGRSSRIPAKRNYAQNAASPDESQNSVLYVTDNLTIQSGLTYTFTNQDIILQSLTLTSISISVSGMLQLINSSISISGASYSTVQYFNLHFHNGSSLELDNSSINAPGSLEFNGSNVTIFNSSISSPVGNSALPESDSITMNVNHTTMDIVNSSITGLYRQSSPHEYNDGSLYLYESGFSKSSTVPMKVSSSLNNESYINRIKVNVTYQGASNESVNTLEVYYNNSFLTNFSLPYQANQSYRNEKFTLNFTGRLHNLTWMENTSNFRFVANMSYATAIALTNVTVDMMSNDTVDLYGPQYFSYKISNSTVLFYGSSLGLNENRTLFPSGEPDFDSLSIVAMNSTIISGDTTLAYPGSYYQPFFSLSNSRLLLFREIRINSSYLGIPYSGLNYTLEPANYSSNGIQKTTFSFFLEELNRLSTGWLSGVNHEPVLYEATNNGVVWNYTDEFALNASPGNLMIPLDPYPHLPGSTRLVNYSFPVPNAIFSVATHLQKFNGNVTVNYTGNLSELNRVEIDWTLFKNGAVSENGTDTIIDPGQTNSLSFTTGPVSQFNDGNYTLEMQIVSGGLHVFRDSSNLTTSFLISSLHPIQTIDDITEKGLPTGMFWGLKYNGTDFFSTNSTIVIPFEVGRNITVMVPKGESPSAHSIKLSSNETNYTVTFSRICYRLTFVNNIQASGIQWGVVVDGHNYTTENNTLTVSLYPGLYNYIVYGSAGYIVQNSSGIVNISTGTVNVSIFFHKDFSIGSFLLNKISNPSDFIPLTAVSFAAIVLLVRFRYHTWYACDKCGTTRNRKKDSCPTCSLPQDPVETIFWEEDWD